MKDLEVKKNVLQEIMDLMDAREGDSLKKHPKLIAAKIEVDKPETKEEMPESEDETEMMPETEEKSEMADDEIDPEDLERLMELHKSLKS